MTEISVEFSLAAAKARAAYGGTVYRELDVRTSAGPLMIGVDGAEQKHLFVPVVESEAVEGHDGVALRIDERVLTADTPTRVADLYCTDPRLEEMFERLVDSMVSLVRDAGPKVSAQATLQNAVAQWKELLSERRTPHEEEQGLFGELHVLGLVGQHDPLWALAAWRGPDRARHDFMTEHGALEVKAVGLQAQEVPISSIAQLDPDGSPRLGLVRVRLEERPEGVTTQEVVERLAARGFPQSLLETRVRSVLGSDASTARRFTVESVSLFEVDEKFPSLRASDIPVAKRPHVSVRYSLRLDGLESVPTDDGRRLVEYLSLTGGSC